MKDKIYSKSLNVNGNQIAVVSVTENSFKNFQSNYKLRRQFVKNYKNKVDTIMLVSQIDSTLIKTLIFEPNAGNDTGSFSCMCGNGLRAVKQVTDASIFLTPAGTFYSVELDCEKFLCIRYCLSTKIKQEKIIKSLIRNLFQIDVLEVRLSQNVENPSYKGEPHLTILLQSGINIDQLKSILKNLGYKLSYMLNQSEQVNVTLVSQISTQSKKAVAATFERNLGSNPEFAITGSCGTGAMAAANLISKFYELNLKDQTFEGFFELYFPEDVQKILIKNNQTYIFTTNNYESI